MSDNKEVDRSKLTASEDLELAMLEAHEEMTAKDAKKEEPEAKEEPAHDDSDDEPKEAKKATSQKEEDDSDDSEESEVEESEDEEDEKPQSWAKNKEKLWKSLPKEARSYWRERESDLTKLVQQKASEYDLGLKSIQGVVRATEPHVQKWGLKGITVEQGVTQALALQEALQKADKFELAKKFLKASGKSVEDLSEAKKDPSDDLRDELKSVKQKLEERERSESEAVVRNRTQELARSYNQFATAKTETGEEKYPSCKVPAFAKAVGSRVSELAQEFPDATYDQLVAQSYKDLGGQIQAAAPQPRSPNQTKKLKTALTSSFAKGKSSTSKSTFDDLDDAWESTFQDFGLTD